MRTLTARSLRLQLTIFTAVFVVMTMLVVVSILRDGVNPAWAIGGFAVGLGLGIVLVRVKVLRWEPSDRSVIGTMDAVGGVILVTYLIFVVVRGRIVERGVDDAEAAGVVGLAITAGTMLGHVAFTLRGIRRTLDAAGVSLSDKA